MKNICYHLKLVYHYKETYMLYISLKNHIINTLDKSLAKYCHFLIKKCYQLHDLLPNNTNYDLCSFLLIEEAHDKRSLQLHNSN